MLVEIIITAAIVAAAAYIFFKDTKKSTSGECNCGTCSKSCPKYTMMKEKK